MKNKVLTGAIAVVTLGIVFNLVLNGIITNDTRNLLSLKFSKSNSLMAIASENDWKNKKLKKVDCTCTNKKKGVSLKCRLDGDLEKCSETQQGSNACYKVGLSGMTLLCEGSEVSN